MSYHGPTLATWAHYAANSAFRTNSLRRRCCKPTVHCNKIRDPVDLLEKFRLHTLWSKKTGRLLYFQITFLKY